MPHVSRRKVNGSAKEEAAKLLVTLLADASASTRKQVFKELLTDTEKIMLAKRLSMIYLVNKNVPTRQISDTLGVSLSTVPRFELAVERGCFDKTARWLRAVRIGKPVMQLLEKIASIPFDAQKKSLAQLSKDW